MALKSCLKWFNIRFACSWLCRTRSDWFDWMSKAAINSTSSAVVDISMIKNELADSTKWPFLYSTILFKLRLAAWLTMLLLRFCEPRL